MFLIYNWGNRTKRNNMQTTKNEIIGGKWYKWIYYCRCSFMWMIADENPFSVNCPHPK